MLVHIRADQDLYGSESLRTWICNNYLNQNMQHFNLTRAAAVSWIAAVGGWPADGQVLGTAAERLVCWRVVGQLLGIRTGALAEDPVALLGGRPEHQLPAENCLFLSKIWFSLMHNFTPWKVLDNSVAEAASFLCVSGFEKNFDAAPASTLLYSKPTLLKKQTNVSTL
jgi:hypothetical protein